MDRWFGEARAWLEPMQQEMLELLGELVTIESGSYDKAGVDRLGARLASELEESGFRLSYDRQQSVGDHIRGLREGDGDGQVLVLGHLDTVWPAGTLPDWPFRVEDGRAYGPGVADMKAGLVVALYAIRALQSVEAPLPGRLAFVLTSDEELGSPSARALVEVEARQSQAALVMEPGRGEGLFVTSRGGVGTCELRARGRTAHTTTLFTEPGVNASAIEALALQIVRLHALTRPADKVAVNVGLVRGGAARQVIADEAWAMADLRAPTPELAQELERAVRALAASSPVGTTVEAHLTWTRPAGVRPAATDALASLAREVTSMLGGQDVTEISAGDGSDGSFCVALGVPILDALGPLSGRTCSRDEYVDVDSLVPRAAFMAGVLGRLAEGAMA